MTPMTDALPLNVLIWFSVLPLLVLAALYILARVLDK